MFFNIICPIKAQVLTSCLCYSIGLITSICNVFLLLPLFPSKRHTPIDQMDGSKTLVSITITGGLVKTQVAVPHLQSVCISEVEGDLCISNVLR